jgi:hypothetical protein
MSSILINLIDYRVRPFGDFALFRRAGRSEIQSEPPAKTMASFQTAKDS